MRFAGMLPRPTLPELILLDARLPDIDGYEVCRRLEESEKTRVIPVISLLGIDDAGQKIKRFEADGVDCITKPFHAGEVLGRWRFT